MVLASKAREAEETAVRARFFDQQEAINKELNRLRNVTGCYDPAAAATADAAAGLSSSSQGLPSTLPSSNPLASGGGGDSDRPATIPPSGLGMGGGHGFTTGAPRKSADALRAELNQDASIRALQERVALAGRHHPPFLPLISDFHPPSLVQVTALTLLPNHL